MKKHALLAVATLLATACEQAPVAPDAARPSLSLGAGRQFRFTTIGPPNALSTTVYGINARGDAVGFYVAVDGKAHGFLFRNGVYTTIDYPGASVTQARGISPGGEIVGTYRLPGEPAINSHGFLLTKRGEFVRIDYPGHTNTIAQRILPDGTILGCRHDHDGTTTMVGVVMDRSGNGEISVFASMHNGATPDLRRIAGLYTNTATGQGQGYVIDDGVFKPFMVPGSTATQAWDVNSLGEVTGSYADAGGVHGFVMTGEDFITIDFPGATATFGFGINSGGDVVGRYVAGGKSYGYVASATARHNR